jgi:hypothetical protein
MVAILTLFGGCSHIEHPLSNPISPPLTLVVGRVGIDAAITKSTQIHSFDDPPAPEAEATTLATLLDEIQTHAQRTLTEELARRDRFVVVPFEEARRAQPDIASSDKAWTHDQLAAFGRSAEADLVVDAHILDYGVVRWQYWVTGWFTHASIATTIVGLASAWNPAAIGAYLAVDATTDFPLWWGGAQVFGWAFRPVRIQVDVVQLSPCEGLIWSTQELTIKVPGEAMSHYTLDERSKKEVQLDINLHRAAAAIADGAAERLTPQTCDEKGRPRIIDEFSFWNWLDLLH